MWEGQRPIRRIRRSLQVVKQSRSVTPQTITIVLSNVMKHLFIFYVIHLYICEFLVNPNGLFSGVWQQEMEMWLSSNTQPFSNTLTVRNQNLPPFRSFVPSSNWLNPPSRHCAFGQVTLGSRGPRACSRRISSCCALRAPALMWASTNTVTWQEFLHTLWWFAPTPTSMLSTDSWTAHRWDSLVCPCHPERVGRENILSSALC